MSKNWIKALLSVTLSFVFLLSGCGVKQDDSSTYEKILKILKELKTYEAEARIKYVSNNNTHQYQVIQTAKKTGEYKIEIIDPENYAGNVTLFDGKVVTQYNKNIPGKVSVGAEDTMERYEILVTSFINNFFESKESSIATASAPYEKETVLEATIPGGHEYMATERLWIDNETLKPTALIIYDKKGEERIVISFRTFTYNIKVEDSVFIYKQKQ